MSDLLQRAAWRFRYSFGLQCGSEAELRHRIRRLPARAPANSSFRFPWGEVEYVNASDLRGQYFEIFAQRHYAFKTTNPAPTIIDCGGNIGMSAIWFKQTYPKARLTVFEADPAVAKILTGNLARIGIKDVNVQNAAVWDKAGLISFDNAGRDAGAVRPDGAIKVPSVDIASVIPEHLDLLKLDVEGAEYPIVDRLTQTGAIARIQNIVGEFHIRRGDMDALLKSLRQFREAGMQVTFTSELGTWLGEAPTDSVYELVGKKQVLAQVYAWR